jgi:hypothetical protein
MLTLKKIIKNSFYSIGMFFIAGALTCIGIAIVGFLLCVLRGE